MTEIALIGYGYWGPNVARNININKKFSFKYICDKRQNRIDKAHELFAEKVQYTLDYKEIMNDPEINAVAIAVETESHYMLVKEALKSGKHVYVEKPFTSTVKEAEELKKLALDKNLKIHIDHIMIYHQAFKRIKKYIDAGEIGDIIYIDAARTNLGQIKYDVSSMWDLAVHDLSIIDFISNGDVPIEINAIGDKSYGRKETLTFLTMKYGKFIAHIKSSWLSPLKERRIIIAGTKKMIVFDDIPVVDKLRIFDKGIEWGKDRYMEYSEYAPKPRTGDCIIPYIPAEDALFNSIEYFRNCIINDSESQSGPDQAIRIQKILEKADICLGG